MTFTIWLNNNNYCQWKPVSVINKASLLAGLSALGYGREVCWQVNLGPYCTTIIICVSRKVSCSKCHGLSISYPTLDSNPDRYTLQSHYFIKTHNSVATGYEFTIFLLFLLTVHIFSYHYYRIDG
jgi:hypothetical protein